MALFHLDRSAGLGFSGSHIDALGRQEVKGSVNGGPLTVLLRQQRSLLLVVQLRAFFEEHGGLYIGSDGVGVENKRIFTVSLSSKNVTASCSSGEQVLISVSFIV